jgi:hypothetical protein
LEERQQKDNQARITDLAKLEARLDTENNSRKEEIEALDRCGLLLDSIQMSNWQYF